MNKTNMKFNWKTFGWSMIAHLSLFVIIWLGMCITNTWGWFGKESSLFFVAGFVISGIISLGKELKNIR